MKTIRGVFVGMWCALAYAGAADAGSPVGTAFTYQGQLKVAGAPGNGLADFQFTLFDAATNGNVVGGPVDRTDVQVFNGLFGAELDFGAAVFNGDDRWLQISVDGAPLVPRQRLSPSPYALQTRGLFVDIGGRVGIATTSPGAKLDVQWSNVGVGVFSGDLDPFGVAMFETNSSIPHNHAWFAESGARVFSVTGGGTGYFAGNVGIGDSTPSATLSVGNGDKFRVAGAEGDVTFADDRATIHFPANERFNDAPMIEMFASGTENANRMVLAHSPGASNWGLQFQDTGGNKFHFLRNGASVLTVDLENSAVGVGTSAPAAKLDVAGTARVDVLEIDGGADLSERFVVAGTAEPGMVLAIDPDQPGALCLARGAYDKRVAGIVSGAGGIKSGMVMGQSASVADGGHHVALTGRVYCWCDASKGAIAPGDLLTTSDTPGHAMRVSDHGRSAGAVLGKSLSSLETGRGLVLVLVSLQ